MRFSSRPSRAAVAPLSRSIVLQIGAAVFLSLLALAAFLRPAGAVEIQRVVSPGGIEAWLVEDHTVPLVAMNFSFAAGSTQDPAGKEGLTRLLAATLDEGAGDLTSEDFQARLEELAVSIGFNASIDRFYGSVRTLTGTTIEAFDLARLAMTAPRFDEEPVGRMKAQIVSGIKRSAQSPDTIGSRALMTSAFGDHPYARPRSGTETSVPELTPEDLAAQHRLIMTRDGLAIGVVGAIDAATLGPLLDSVFGGLPETSVRAPVPEVTFNTGARIDKNLNVPQTSLLLGLPGLKRDDPDFAAAFVMNHILGGGTFTSWLYEEVREKRGLTYSTSTSLAPYDHTGVVFASASTRADRATETLEVMLAQFERMANEGPSEAELQSAKRFLTGSYALRFDTSGKIARQLVALQNADLGIDYFDRRNSEIDAITLADVKRVAARLLKDVTPTIVTVGPGIN